MRGSPVSWLFAYLFAVPAIVVLTVSFGLASLLASLVGIGEDRLHRLARIWARAVLRAGRVRLETEGLDKLDPARSYVLVSNHASYMDTPVVVAAIPLQFRFFAKAGLFRIPLLGTHLGRAGHFPVERGNARASLKSMADGARAIAERHVSVLLFPEGGRSETSLREFKEGAAYIAIKAGVPVVPIGLVGTRAVLPMHSTRVRPGVVCIRVGDPIETGAMLPGDRQQLSELLRARVGELTGEAVKEQAADAHA